MNICLLCKNSHLLNNFSLTHLHTNTVINSDAKQTTLSQIATESLNLILPHDNNNNYLITQVSKDT